MDDPLYLVENGVVTQIPGMPPGNGQPLVPHALTFAGLVTGGTVRVYRPSDEALRQAAAHARFMRYDPTIMECVELRQRATALLDWHIEVETQEPTYKAAADIITRIIKRIPRFTQYRDVLMSAIWFGRYAIANEYQWLWIDDNKYVGIRSWIPIHGDKLVWQIDSPLGLPGLEDWGILIGTGAGLSEKIKAWREANRQYIAVTHRGLAYFPPREKRDLVVVHRHLIEDGEYEDGVTADRIFGVGIRTRVYWCWYQKQEALRWLMEFLERSAFGIELWYYPAGNPTAREETLRAAAQRVGTGKNILLVPRPPGAEGAIYGVERIEPSMAGAEVLKNILVEYFGHQIKRYILGQTLTTEAHATGLGSNLATIHLDTFLQIVKYDSANLSETLTDQLVRRLVQWNFPGLEPSFFRFVIEVEKPNIDERLHAIRTAFEMGLRIRAQDLRDITGLGVPSDEEETLQNPVFRDTRSPPPAEDAITAS
jgi:phage gp29-like protein